LIIIVKTTVINNMICISLLESDTPKKNIRLIIQKIKTANICLLKTVLRIFLIEKIVVLTMNQKTK